MAPCARLLLLVAVALLLAPRGALAAPILLESGVGFVTVDLGSPDGISGWTVNGASHLRTQWFWLGFPNPRWEIPEAPIDDQLLTSIVTSDTDGDGRIDSLRANYEAALELLGTAHYVDIRISSTPIGGANEYVSTILTELRFVSLEAPQGGYLYSYSDVDLFGSFDDDEALFSGANAFVVDASGLGSWESSWDLPPDGIETELFGVTLSRLSDDELTTLSGASAASGDVTIAAMWEIDVPAGVPFILRQTQTIRVVPEPGAAVLLALGLAGFAARRKEAGR